MKILYLVHQFFPEYYSGTENFVYRLSSMMQKTGHNVRVITYGFYKDSFFDKRIGDILSKEFTYKGIPVTAIRHKKIPGDINIPLVDKRLSDIADQILSAEDPFLVHVGHPMRVGEFITASRQFDIPYIITLTDFWIICPKVNLVNSSGDLCAGPKGGDMCRTACPELPHDANVERSVFAHDILSGAKKIISPSRFLGGLFKNEFYDLDITVINHGISYKRIKRNNRYYNKGDALTFCYAGTLNDHKGVHIVLDAFQRVPADNIHLKIYGSGPNPLYVNKLYDMGRKDRRIEFRGIYSEDDVGEILSNVDVVIIPSIVYENYPLVLHEALACHTPVIASNIGGMAEKVQNGINGFTFIAGDPEDLSTVMKRIIADPEILNVLKENIKGAPILTVEQEAYAYARIYKEITQGRV